METVGISERIITLTFCSLSLAPQLLLCPFVPIVPCELYIACGLGLKKIWSIPPSFLDAPRCGHQSTVVRLCFLGPVFFSTTDRGKLLRTHLWDFSKASLIISLLAEDSHFWPVTSSAHLPGQLHLLPLCYMTVPCCAYAHRTAYFFCFGQALPYIYSCN